MKSLHILPLLLVVLVGCGPGATDGAHPIKDGYLFYETGGNGKTIEFEQNGGEMRNVVPQRVDAYVVDGKKIVVARRPARGAMRGDIADWKLSSICEYWIIDTESHAVEQIADASKWPGVRCDMGRTYGAQVERAR